MQTCGEYVLPLYIYSFPKRVIQVYKGTKGPRTWGCAVYNICLSEDIHGYTRHTEPKMCYSSSRCWRVPIGFSKPVQTTDTGSYGPPALMRGLHIAQSPQSPGQVTRSSENQRRRASSEQLEPLAHSRLPAPLTAARPVPSWLSSRVSPPRPCTSQSGPTAHSNRLSDL